MFILWILEIHDSNSKILSSENPPQLYEQHTLLTFQYNSRTPANWTHPEPPRFAYFDGSMAQLHEFGYSLSTHTMRATYRMDLKSFFRRLITPENQLHFHPGDATQDELRMAARQAIEALEDEDMVIWDHHPLIDQVLPGLLEQDTPF
ncbi:hypothetical protein [Deinococcus roseus]|uniref:Uncharacterized protein n=1 Tax=Deinococcus roseus TaxID=392414 RepID=A0ABQ2DF38_9DEIO|nr:hypothetical protein [Deinococcus roseus]GGJ55742.1 hypothetical protein GCM10008938_47420 [Deinococcus roseus]